MSLNLGIIASQRTSASAALLLDSYPNAAAAYSLRKLRNAYTGPAIRVRRTNDSAEIDIGFVNNVLDTTTLLTFVGAFNGLVRIWYDQSGNNNNAGINSLAPSAPIIVVNGILQTQNSKPCIRFRQSNYDQLLMTNALLADTNISIFMTAKGNDLTNHGPVLGGSGGPPTCLFGYLAPSEQNLGYIGLLNGVGKIVYTVPNFANSNYLIYQAITNSTNIYLYQNNNTFTQTISGFSPVAPSFNKIGAYFAYSTNGIFSELVFYKTDQSANRTGIVNNTNSFYSIF